MDDPEVPGFVGRWDREEGRVEEKRGGLVGM